MGRGQKIPEEKVELIQKLYDKDQLTVSEIAKRAGVSYNTAWGYTKAMKVGASSPAEYQKQRAIENGFTSLSSYHQSLPSGHTRPQAVYHAAYKKKWLEKNGVSESEYTKRLRKKRQNRPENREMSRLIIERLRELDQTPAWLARQLGLGETAVSEYTKGRLIPRKSIQKKLFEALELPYRTIDDVLDDGIGAHYLAVDERLSELEY